MYLSSLPAISSGKRQISGARLPSSRQIGKQSTVFVIRVSSCVEYAPGDPQPFNCLTQGHRSPVFRGPSVGQRATSKRRHLRDDKDKNDQA